MICRECGARIDDDAAECKFCGAVYGSTEPESEEVPEITNEPVEEETNATQPEKDEVDELFDENEAKRRAQMEKIRMEKQTQLEEIEKRRKDKKRKQRRNRLLIVLLILLCIAAVAAGIYYVSPSYSGGNGDDVVIVTPAPTETAEATQTPEETAEPLPTETPEPVAETTQTPSGEVSATVAPTKKTTVSNATQKPAQTVKPTTVQPKPQATKKPQTAQKLSSAIITGGEVIKDNGQSYMSFTHNGKWYYAKVSDNTTTNFIAWKTMTLSGYCNGETYNGVPVYTITKLTHYNGSYLIPESGTRLLTTADLEGKTAAELRLARNEIYARHGRKFNDAELQNYFNSCSWYKPSSSYNYANESTNLNSIEKQNVTLIKNYEDSIK